MSKVGRPLKLNEIVIQMLEKAYSLGMSPKLACDHASVSQSSYNTWMQRGEQDRYDNEETIFADLNRRVKKQGLIMHLLILHLFRRQQKKMELGLPRHGSSKEYTRNIKNNLSRL